MSADRWILAVDLGSGGPKVGVVSLRGELRHTAHRSVSFEVGHDGAGTQDAEEWWTALGDAAREAIAGASAQPDALHAIALTGQWGSTVPVGADGRPVGPALLWADTRAKDLVRDVIGGPLSIDGFAPHKAFPFVRLTGGAPNPNGADPTGHALLLRERMPQIYEQVRVLLEPVDYLGLRFTGRAAATPASMLLSWLTDNRLGAPHGYVDSLITRARRDRDRLPELLPTGSVLGPLLPDVAAWLGVAAGAPVVCGLPDLHTAVLGSGAVAPFDTHLAISTTAWIGARVPFKRTDVFRSIATVPGLDPHFPIVANNHDTGGAALQWVRDQLLTPEGAPPPTFESLVDLAATAPPGSEGLLFMPWLNGERSPVEDKLLRGGWLNVSLATNRAKLVRSVLEGVAYNARWLFDAYEGFVGHTIPKLRVLGGGAQSALWCQIHADILQRPLEQVSQPRNAQLRGAALWARICLKELRLEDVPALVEVAATFQPNSCQATDAGYREFRSLYKRLRGLYQRLNGPHV